MNFPFSSPSSLPFFLPTPVAADLAAAAAAASGPDATDAAYLQQHLWTSSMTQRASLPSAAADATHLNNPSATNKALNITRTYIHRVVPPLEQVDNFSSLEAVKEKWLVSFPMLLPYRAFQAAILQGFFDACKINNLDRLKAASEADVFTWLSGLAKESATKEEMDLWSQTVGSFFEFIRHFRNPLIQHNPVTAYYQAQMAISRVVDLPASAPAAAAASAPTAAPTFLPKANDAGNLVGQKRSFKEETTSAEAVPAKKAHIQKEEPLEIEKAWMSAMAADHKAQRTIETYYTALRYFKQFMGILDYAGYEALTREDFVRWQNSCSETHHSSTYVTPIRAFYRFLGKEEMVANRHGVGALYASTAPEPAAAASASAASSNERGLTFEVRVERWVNATFCNKRTQEVMHRMLSRFGSYMQEQGMLSAYENLDQKFIHQWCKELLDHYRLTHSDKRQIRKYVRNYLSIITRFMDTVYTEHLNPCRGKWATEFLDGIIKSELEEEEKTKEIPSTLEASEAPEPEAAAAQSPLSPLSWDPLNLSPSALFDPMFSSSQVANF